MTKPDKNKFEVQERQTFSWLGLVYLEMEMPEFQENLFGGLNLLSA